MSDLYLRFKHIFLPYLIFSLGFIVVYTFFHWLFVIQLRWLAISESIVTTGIPLTICWIPTLFWIVPKIHFLKLETNVGRGNPTMIYFFFVAFATCWPVRLAQDYLIAATDKLTLIKSVNEVSQKPLTRYYKIADFYADKNQASVYSKNYLSGKNDDFLNIGIYYACPVYPQPILPDSLNRINLTKQKTNTGTKSAIWLGIKYEEQIRNSNPYDNEIEIARFTDNVDAWFKSKNLHEFSYLERTENSGTYQAYFAAINTTRDIKLTKAIIFEARSTPFGTEKPDNKQKLIWFFVSLIGVELAWLLMILIPDLNDVQMEQYR